MRSIVIGVLAVGAAAALGGQVYGPSPGLISHEAVPAFTMAGSPMGGGQRPSDRSAETLAVPANALTEVVQRYCMVCHNDQLMTGNISFQGFEVASAAERADVAEKMITKLRLEMMPPPGIPRPAGDTLMALAETLETVLDAAYAADPNPQTRVFQRMTQQEFERVIRDMLALEVNASRWLPQDRFSGTFDTRAEAQGISTTVVEAYMRAAEDISRLAMGNPAANPEAVAYSMPIEAAQHAWDHVEGAPFGTRGGMVVRHDFPADGKYAFAVTKVLGKNARFEDIDVSVDGEQVALLSADGPDEVRTEPVFVRAGQRQVSVAFVRRTGGLYDNRLSPPDWSFAGGEDQQGWANYGVTALPHLTSFVVDGPYDASGVSETPSRQAIFTCRPETPSGESSCAESIIRRIATIGYRRSVTDEEMARLMSFYERDAADEGFEIGVRTGIQAVLSSPSFIFRLEQEPAGVGQGENYVLSDADLASRLSFFLWGTVPDAELRDAAESRTLRNPGVLEGPVRRMLEDPRSEALATRFAVQWLHLGGLSGAQPEAHQFPDYTQQLGESMLQETLLFFDHLVREDRSFLDLFEADYTFVDERLARHYGLPFTTIGNEFQRVQVTDPNRRGLLGHASILTLTSMADRTSPVVRGEWVMTNLLGSPPPPPPPNVPALDQTSNVGEGRFLTTRERMEIHRANPTCNSCHQFIDPIGLSLDNFNPVGQWRIRESGRPLDTQGTYYDGTTISSPADLRDALLRRPKPLVRQFTNQLLEFALGRGTEATDQPVVRAITRNAERNDYRMSSFIIGVVQSDPFQMKRVEVVAEASN